MTNAHLYAISDKTLLLQNNPRRFVALGPETYSETDTTVMEDMTNCY